jgi:hypothetical protein
VFNSVQTSGVSHVLTVPSSSAGRSLFWKMSTLCSHRTNLSVAPHISQLTKLSFLNLASDHDYLISTDLHS